MPNWSVEDLLTAISMHKRILHSNEAQIEDLHRRLDVYDAEVTKWREECERLQEAIKRHRRDLDAPGILFHPDSANVTLWRTVE